MTATAPPADAPVRRRRGVLLWLAILASLILLAVVVGPPADDGEALDPRSTGPLGARGLVLLLEELGGRVTIGDRVPGDGTDTALVLRDELSDEQRTGLARWVAQGGTLVVADPGSSLSGETLGDPIDAGPIDRGTCDVSALDGADLLDVDGGTTFVRSPGSAGCFGDEREAVVVVAGRGRGLVVSIGAPSLLVNERLDEEANAVVAAALLAPSPGTTVAILEPAAPGGGDETLADLVPDRLVDALLQLALAFGVYALWRARRLGRPVVEPQPVQIEGSELVVAVGNLLQGSKDPERAAALLRRDLHRRLAGRFGLAAAAPAEQVADVVSARSAVDRDRIVAALAGSPVRNEAELLSLGREIDRIRQETLHGR